MNQQGSVGRRVKDSSCVFWSDVEPWGTYVLYFSRTSFKRAKMNVWTGYSCINVTYLNNFMLDSDVFFPGENIFRDGNATLFIFGDFVKYIWLWKMNIEDK